MNVYQFADVLGAVCCTFTAFLVLGAVAHGVTEKLSHKSWTDEYSWLYLLTVTLICLISIVWIITTLGRIDDATK